LWWWARRRVMRAIIAHWIIAAWCWAAVRSRARCAGAVDPGERALHAPASGQHERAEHRVPAHGERGHRRDADGDEGKDREPGERGAEVDRRCRAR
jgi:hypothetical protein